MKVVIQCHIRIINSSIYFFYFYFLKTRGIFNRPGVAGLFYKQLCNYLIDSLTN